jgi:hypothetical protein
MCMTDPLDWPAQTDFSLGSGTYEPEEHFGPVLQFSIFHFHTLIGHN